MNYYVLEIQTNADGTCGSLIWAFADKNSSEDKYLALRQTANDSSVMIHTIIWMTNKGEIIDKKAYVHPVPAPEPEEEQES